MKRLTLLVLLLSMIVVVYGQQYVVRFSFTNISQVPQFVSIDNVKDTVAVGYIWGKDNYQKFKQIFPRAQLLNNYLKSKSVLMAQTPDEMKDWDRYPTYDTYVEMMKDYATKYPSLCRLDTIGTSQQGRLLLSLVISDNPDNTKEFEPRFFYTSTMHGDEVTGYVVLLRLIDYLLSNYNKDSLVTYLVNNYRIYINPLANPDGTYHGGNSTVTGAIRYYANGQDPNRDFYPIPADTGRPGSQETEEMKAYAQKNHFVMSMNLHGGSEVFNYPWDVYTSDQDAHADDGWFRTIGQRFVDTARLVDQNYMTDVTSSGITEGGDWYVVSGSRQDYMNFTQHCKEVTYEISSTKTPSSDQLPYFWNVSYRSLLYYILEEEHGLQGVILDSNGHPIKAQIFVNNYDKDSSQVYSLPCSGVYFRPLLPRNYDVSFLINGKELLHKTVYVGQGRTIVNYIPNPQKHKVTFVVKNAQGQLQNNVNLLIINNKDSIKATINGTYTDSLITGIYCINLKDTALNYNQLFYEEITDNDTLTYILPSTAVSRVPNGIVAKDVRIYPIPAHERVTIQGNNIRWVKIFSIAGRLIKQISVNGNRASIDITSLHPGIYLMQIQTAAREPTVKKLLVE